MSVIPTKTQISAGGVVYRQRGDARVEVALISVGDENRWQLPKGLVDAGEATEAAAIREAREETGIETELVALVDKIEYWYYATNRGGRVRFHKFVHFYLLRYLSGDVGDHDAEVNEARWFEIDEARARLAFAGERKVLERARAMLAAASGARPE
ncbi:MAG TPA: NUDIX domain-containing protein [Pyrinomonadaceae bacterium]|jgi:8-oxo-dGTP pyrophosphatase MutT (NUDIX family)